jgi:hypothetical protein
MDEALKRRLTERHRAQPIPAAQLVKCCSTRRPGSRSSNPAGRYVTSMSHQFVRLESRLQTVRDTSAPKKN